jgi:hypothetical protein
MAGPAGAAGAAAAKKLADAAFRIFGSVTASVGRSGRKLLQRPLMGEKMASYYGEKPIGRIDPLYEDPMDE